MPFPYGTTSTLLLSVDKEHGLVLKRGCGLERLLWSFVSQHSDKLYSELPAVFPVAVDARGSAEALQAKLQRAQIQMRNLKVYADGSISVRVTPINRSKAKMEESSTTMKFRVEMPPTKDRVNQPRLSKAFDTTCDGFVLA